MIPLIITNYINKISQNILKLKHKCKACRLFNRREHFQFSISIKNRNHKIYQMKQICCLNQ